LLPSLEKEQGHFRPYLPKYPHHLKMRWNHQFEELEEDISQGLK
jgi:hypothetical protein